MKSIENTPYLKRLSDNKEYPLVGGSIVIGRRETCEIALTDENGVSRQHATVSIQDDDVIIEDLGSTNGVRLNGVKISAPTKVNAGDTLIFDVFEYQLKTPQTAPNEEDKTTIEKVVSEESAMAVKQAAEQEQAVQEQVEPVQAEPVQAEPIQAVQEQVEPVQVEPVQVEPVQAVPVQAEPVQAVPEQAEPAQAVQEQAKQITESPVVSDPTPSEDPIKAKAVSAPPAQKQNSTVNTAEQPIRKAAWIDERNAGATMFMPGAESAIDTDQIASIKYNGEEPALILIEGGDVGQEFKLYGDKDKWSIGSAETQDIVLSKEGVSQSHATLSRDGNKWEIRDLVSQNGIRVNGNKRLHSYLSNEDVIKFGPMKCLFVIPKGYKNVVRPIASVSEKKRNLQKSILVVFVLVISVLAAAIYFNLIDLTSFLTAIKGR